jgi:hypothetical protein
MSYNYNRTPPRDERILELHSKLRFWRRLCAMLGTLLLACATVIVLAYFKLP